MGTGLQLSTDGVAALIRYIVKTESESGTHYPLIPAIKVLRSITGFGLKHSKDLIEIALEGKPPRDPLEIRIEEILEDSATTQPQGK